MGPDHRDDALRAQRFASDSEHEVVQTNPLHLILAEFKLVLVRPHCLPQMPQIHRYDTIFWRYYHAYQGFVFVVRVSDPLFFGPNM